MSDEMMLQNQRPSAVPYVLGGAAIGGAAGAMQPWVGVKKPKYASFDDILKDSKDTFAKAKEDAKKDDVKEAYNKIIAEREAYDKVAATATDAKKCVLADETMASWDPELETAGKAWEEAGNKVTAEKTNVIEDIKTKIKNGEIEVAEMTKEEAAAAEDAVLQEKAEVYFRENEAKLAEESSAVKDSAKLLNDAKAEETRLRGELDKVAQEKGKKAEKILTEEGKKAIADIEKTLTEAKSSASEALKDVLGKIKKPNKLMNGIIGAATLAILTPILFRPRSKE